ncbi:MAG: valine--tRNA ligase [Deltaproteobacteria bacterium]|jgi:valyl-tRNA synthetase|nr:valine--tRNA ligase [Deltaproteobacteria bacterium]
MSKEERKEAAEEAAFSGQGPEESENFLPRGYSPREVEARWRERWERNRTFTPVAPAEGEPFSIVIPPPNVTGNLHIGHAFNLTVQDLLCRHARQMGRTVLWVPGEDHAGIATQNVVERRLAAEGKSRHDLGREAFIARVWRWKEEYGENIRAQIKAMGASVDWSRERFTMDEGLSRAVRRVFVRLHREGLIYRGDYIVNWCTRCHTALADDEVEYAELPGKIWNIRYPLEEGGFIGIATTRPETLPGDSAVAVHPEDERYLGLIGKKAVLPLLGRRLTILADSYVDRSFGSGALKVTPAHDRNDWELGLKHGLECIQVIDDNGRMKENAGVFAGLPKEEARKKVLEALEEAGLLEGEREHVHNVGHCYRCGEIIEPHVSTQWFVAVRPLAEKARAAVPAETRIYPDSWSRTYYNWMDNIRDWCISRQIWWGHRIPAWTCRGCGELIVEEEAPAACPRCRGKELEQDPDVLDTWFSSALWPFSTLGWPDSGGDLETFYPTSVLVTGFDIIFFWVARMMMMGLHFLGKAPFREVYIHALVRDAKGDKMSKSRGNVINPLEMIAKYGTDALRFTLTAFAAMGRDIRLSEERIEGYRHFVNKIWNAARFALMHLRDETGPCPEKAGEGDGGRGWSGENPEAGLESIPGTHHEWILHRLEETKRAVPAAIREYRFNDAAQELYKFVWSELCDWYLELIKPDMQAGGLPREQARRVLLAVLRETMLLLHPVMPFVTAEIWSALSGFAGGVSPDIALEPYPAARPACIRPACAGRMEMIQAVITALRTIRAELNIAPSRALRVLIRPADEDRAAVLEGHRSMLVRLARLEELRLERKGEAPRPAAEQVAAGNEIFVSLEGVVDLPAERARLDKELAKLEKERLLLQGKLENRNYVEKAPAELVERDRRRVAELGAAEEKLRGTRQGFMP